METEDLNDATDSLGEEEPYGPNFDGIPMHVEDDESNPLRRNREEAFDDDEEAFDDDEASL